MPFNSSQRLNDWVTMLHAIYGGSQNYAKTPHEIHAHLTEVCGVFAKQVLKRKDFQKAQEFLPKIFAWAIALLKKMHPDRTDLEEMILRKFPYACSYCLGIPCICWNQAKPTVNEAQLRTLYYQRAPSIRRTVNDFQLMFREIYSDSWVVEGNGDVHQVLRNQFVRLIEELSELGESVRFHHLYPVNFENEIADFFAWWFALVSSMPATNGGQGLLAEDCLWSIYPGQCRDCQMLPCLCRPGPVRRLMSRPIPGQDHRFDSLTSALNQAAYNEDITQIAEGSLAVAFPSCCARIDVDDFKAVNDQYGHSAGDEALTQIASLIRSTVRERDRVYRISGDEYGVLFTRFSEEEAAGAMRRLCGALAEYPIRWVGQDGTVFEFPVSVSIGVAEFSQRTDVIKAFESADRAAYASKRAGKDRVSKASELEAIN
jgi:diguanylate cyclase (GGDEF)-like protein